MTVRERLRLALRSPQPAPALRSLVHELHGQGRNKAEIYELLENYLVEMRTQPGHAEPDEDVLLDVMDALTGWCHPDVRLLPDDTAV
jgi:hypothetical protein